ncbi:MAG: ECF transporter S component [Candidatus Muirbacterium halophilum]|nr:ECF transporter S component [Candidatus Muirbacterium halophilum]MCK9476604.1 ECF transporter S component [Candidatus Muirbacterium halophilum]
MNNTKKLILSSLLLALSMLLPFLTGQIPQIGNMLTPMHIPVLLCGFLCGWPYGLIIGFIAPLLRFFLFGMPPLIPIGILMTFELATYGFVSGYIFNKVKPTLSKIYITLIISMICGRIIWGITSYILANILNMDFSLQIYINLAFITAIPGIIFQLITIPAIVFKLGSNHSKTVLR